MQVGVLLDLWLQQVEVEQRRFVHSGCKSAFRVHGRHNPVINAVPTFSRGRLLLFSKCVCGHLSVYGGVAVIFFCGRRMGLRHWISGELVMMVDVF